MENDLAIPSSIRLNGATRVDRLVCKAKIRDIIVAGCHGWIGDFYQFSNTSLCLHFEIPAGNLAVLCDALSEAGIGFGPDAEKVNQSMSCGFRKSDIVSCTLQITFVHNEPDLRRQIPAVPG